MRRSNAWILLLAVLLAPTAIVAKEAEDKSSDKPQIQPSRQEICQMIEEAAAKENLPFDFFTRLIWRESRFDPRAVSPAGAQGIAQFMPKTANGRGLDNPFDPFPALMESAEYLRELLQRFGNLGLAAAAYNAGPGRVKTWLDRRGPPLKRETHDYVEIITGHAPQKWAGGEAPKLERANESDCDQLAKVAIARQIRIASQGKRDAAESEQRKAAKPEVRIAAATGRNLAKTKGRVRVAAEMTSARRSPAGQRNDKVRIADNRRKGGEVRGGKTASHKIKAAENTGRSGKSLRITAKPVERTCSSRSGGRKTCREA
jgi:Transglycosylase SLT domain